MSIGGEPKGGGGNSNSTPAPTPEEHALAEVGAKRFNEIAGDKPLRDKALEYYADPTHGERLAGAANASVTAATKDGVRDSLYTTAGTGHGYGSGQSVMSMALSPLKAASATGEATGAARQAAKDRELRGLNKMYAWYNDVQDTTDVGLRSAAEDAARSSINDANIRTDDYVALNEGLAKMVGFVGGRFAYEGGLQDQVEILNQGKAPDDKTRVKPRTPFRDFVGRL